MCIRDSAWIVPTTDFHGSEYVNDYFKCREYLSGFTGSAGTLAVTQDAACLLYTSGLMKTLMAVSAVLTCVLVAFLIIYVMYKGLPNLSWELLTTESSLSLIHI